MASEAIIRVENLTRRFGKMTALDGLNLEIARGEVFGLLGPDGAGKTTTLRLLSGLMDPSEGRAWVAGHDVVRETEAVKDRIGYMAQRFGLYADLTVEENMRFYADLFGLEPAEFEPLMARLLKMTRMEPFRAREAGRLSGGMKQKLALGCTLLHHPEVLLLDEPTNGVDPVSRRDFWLILEELVRGGLTVLVTTSYLDEAERCHRVGLLHEGRMIRVGAPDALKSGMEEDCYAVECEDSRAWRARAQHVDGVVSVEPAGARLHMFLAPGVEPERISAAAGPCRMERIAPSLEDVFIGMIRKASRERTGSGT